MSDLTITSASILVAPAVSDFGIAPFNQGGITSTDGATTSSGALGVITDFVTLSADARTLPLATGAINLRRHTPPVFRLAAQGRPD